MEKIRTRYIDELSKNADTKKRELDSIMEAKATAEQIADIIEDMSQLMTRIESAKADATKIKGGISKNVQ